MFKALGVLLAGYTLYAALRGEVYAKAGPGGRLVTRRASSAYFWTVIGIYSALSLALLTVF
jgi:hypothetical protein